MGTASLDPARPIRQSRFKGEEQIIFDITVNCDITNSWLTIPSTRRGQFQSLLCWLRMYLVLRKHLQVSDENTCCVEVSITLSNLYTEIKLNNFGYEVFIVLQNVCNL